jgi:hypothetical protein
MTRAVLALAAVALLGGCFGGQPEGPTWRIRAAEASERYYRAMLAGDAQRANSNLRQALEAASRSDDLTALARVHLGRAAMQVALRREPDLGRAEELVALTGDERLAAYQRLLAGTPRAGDADRLPDGLGPVARYLTEARPGRLAGAVTAIAEPRRRLVAAALAYRRYPERRAFVDAAVAAASGEGWRGALLTWLPLQAEAAERAGHSGEAAAIRDRLRWLRDPLGGQPGTAGEEAGR